MPFVRTALAATAACLIGGLAHAQTPAAADQTAPPSTATTGAVANTSATVDQNGVEVIASAPVPDTRANRAAYGQPLSRAGKRTAAAGN